MAGLSDGSRHGVLGARAASIRFTLTPLLRLPLLRSARPGSRVVLGARLLATRTPPDRTLHPPLAKG